MEIDLSTLGVFIAASLALYISPGPDMVYVASRAMGQGARAGVISALGISSGILVHMFAASFGLAALLQGMAGGVPDHQVGGHRIPGLSRAARPAEPRRDRHPATDANPARRLAAVPSGVLLQHPEPEDRDLLPRLPAAVHRRPTRQHHAADAVLRRRVGRRRTGVDSVHRLCLRPGRQLVRPPSGRAEMAEVDHRLVDAGSGAVRRPGRGRLR